MELQPMHFDYIDVAYDLETALRITGQWPPLDAHDVRMAYIKHRRGYRALGGFFNPTRRNVRLKFAEVWQEERLK